VRSQLMYCSQICWSNLAKGIQLLEKVQWRVTNFILNDYSSSYKIRLTKLSMLALMFIFELNDLLFLFIKSIKNPSSHFDITRWAHFNRSGCTRSSSHSKLVYNHTLMARSWNLARRKGNYWTSNLLLFERNWVKDHKDAAKSPTVGNNYVI